MGVRIREREGEAIALCAAVLTVTFQRGDRVSTPWLGRASTPDKHNMCSIGDFRGQPGHCLQGFSSIFSLHASTAVDSQRLYLRCSLISTKSTLRGDQRKKENKILEAFLYLNLYSNRLCNFDKYQPARGSLWGIVLWVQQQQECSI